MELTEGVLFRKNLNPFRISGELFYTYTAPGSTAADGHRTNSTPSTFELFGIEPAVQYRFGEHWVGAAGVLFTVAGQNNIDAIYPNFSLYYCWDKKGSATMR